MNKEQIRKIVINAMEYRWNDFVGDTHELPNDIEISNPRTKVSFTPRQWASNVADDVAEDILSEIFGGTTG